MPDYDGRYVCEVVESTECGNKITKLEVIQCRMNEWVLPENYTINRWFDLYAMAAQTATLKSENERLMKLLEDINNQFELFKRNNRL